MLYVTWITHKLQHNLSTFSSTLSLPISLWNKIKSFAFTCVPFVFVFSRDSPRVCLLATTAQAEAKGGGNILGKRMEMCRCKSFAGEGEGTPSHQIMGKTPLGPTANHGNRLTFLNQICESVNSSGVNSRQANLLQIHTTAYFDSEECPCFWVAYLL